MEKGIVEYVGEILELIPVMVATGIALKDAITWALGKLKSFEGGKVPTAADWDELRAFRSGKKAELQAAIAKLVAMEAAFAIRA